MPLSSWRCSTACRPLIWLGAALLGWIAGEVIATDPAIAPWLHRVLDGHIALDLDTTSTIFGFAKHLKFDGEIGEITLALLGVIVVLVVGSIWRKRALREQHEAPAAA